jgi:hypothetical protein
MTTNNFFAEIVLGRRFTMSFMRKSESKLDTRKVPRLLLFIRLWRSRYVGFGVPPEADYGASGRYSGS